MASYNEVTLLGNVGKDPRITETQKNTVARFSVATSYGEGDNKRTDWHYCEAWGQPADVVKKYVKKGSPVLVNGRLQYETYKDDKGQDRERTKIVVGRIVLCGNTAQPQQQQQVQTQAEVPARVNLSAPVNLDEGPDLPF